MRAALLVLLLTACAAPPLIELRDGGVRVPCDLEAITAAPDGALTHLRGSIDRCRPREPGPRLTT